MASFRINRASINRIAKSAELRQVCLSAVEGIAATAEGIMPEASYKTDAITGRMRVRARVRAFPPEGNDYAARREFYEHPPIFGIAPRV